VVGSWWLLSCLRGPSSVVIQDFMSLYYSVVGLGARSVASKSSLYLITLFIRSEY